MTYFFLFHTLFQKRRSAIQIREEIAERVHFKEGITIVLVKKITHTILILSMSEETNLLNSIRATPSCHLYLAIVILCILKCRGVWIEEMYMHNYRK